VIQCQIPYLLEAGFLVDIYAFEVFDPLLHANVSCYRIPTHLRGLAWALANGGYFCIIAHANPFYWLLPQFTQSVQTIAYEHGEPPAAWFPAEQDWRQAQRVGMVESVYPKVSKVVAISQFIANDIRWPHATILYNGADHLANLYAQSSQTGEAFKNSPVMTLLCISRLGEQESLYKGFDLLHQLRLDLDAGWNIVLVGKGCIDDKVRLERIGLDVHINISDEELARHYERSNAVVSFSRWEGFNLPLVEAGFFHKPAFALNYGAHKEVTPFCFNNYEQILVYLRRASFASLQVDGETMWNFVQRFRWVENGHGLLDIVVNKTPIQSTSLKRSLRFSAYHLYLISREFVRRLWRHRG
jgi:glycosyltransferase involved in cell wall biosynthesis